jgi:short-subunit dehydrogenase
MLLGASGGIGRAYAAELAGRGYRLLLVAQNAVNLEQLAAELRVAHGVTIETLAANLAEEAGVAQVEQRLASDREITLYVNCAGVASWGRFADLDWQRELKTIQINLLAAARLTRAALTNMLPRRCGAIINVASLAGFFPLPYCAVYGATKAFLISFTEAVYEELRGSGLRIQVCCPGFVRTGMFARSGADVEKLPRFIWIRPEAIARQSLAALRRDRPICIPGLGFRLLAFLSRFTPRGGARRHAAQFFGNFAAYRLDPTAPPPDNTGTA